ncbi:helix-turn-helix domain-containing protein [Anoxynatronum buryatiense]|uniref:Helix-turn-helix n=1 Tax=Anoxynatronum buryatiense TaxID=489973 RepID=A0AA46AKL1_9CLOT|nr:helix-turn-helix transcriptional regulator [Anoxynatronum buryatiense]SMP72071.1 Helix-turn-helix [Anoxynatronum buryatiense]
MTKRTGIISKNIGAAILYARKRNNLSLQELATRSGVSASNINRIENGKRRPTLTTVELISEGLGIELDNLINTAKSVEYSKQLSAEDEALFIRTNGED